MGFFRNTVSKSVAMKKAENAILNTGYNSPETNKAFGELLEAMVSMDNKLSILVEKHNLSSGDLLKISRMIFLCGYGRNRGDYLPIALISFEKPLKSMIEESMVGTEKCTDMHLAVTIAMEYLYNRR